MSHSHLKRRALTAGSLALAAGALAPAGASAAEAWSFPTVGGAKPAAACTADPPTTQAFAKYRDLADYALAPGGDFETGAPGWVFANSKIVAGNETSGITPGKMSVLLGVSRNGGAASITSPEFCLTQDHPTFRAVVKSVGSSVYRSGFGSNIVYRTTTELGQSFLDLVAVQGASTSWRPTAINPLATEIPVAKFSSGVLVKVKFYLPAYNVKDGGAIQIDSLMIDPYRRS
ncbi:MAG: hypothetical protein Q7T55_06750 [Solirubrobacteraceae bacterium]|nr:hypothetical protein [Solirubrobacteraceae bacterium]